MTYVTSDLHGYSLEEVQRLFEKADFSKDDKCYILGDVIDRGKDSIKLLRWIMQNPNMQLLLGNHEQMLLESVAFLDTDESVVADHTISGLFNFNLWMTNGGRTTFNELQACHPKIVKSIVRYLSKAPIYKEITVNEKKFVLCHSGLGNFNKNKSLEDYTADELLWTRPTRITNYYYDAIVILGHTPTCFFGDEYIGKMMRTSTWIDIDAGCACGYAPMLLRLEDMKEFYLD